MHVLPLLVALCRPPRQYQPVRECLGWVLLQQGQLQQAEQVGQAQPHTWLVAADRVCNGRRLYASAPQQLAASTAARRSALSVVWAETHVEVCRYVLSCATWGGTRLGGLLQTSQTACTPLISRMKPLHAGCITWLQRVAVPNSYVQ
jgi:hypothetical protein